MGKTVFCEFKINIVKRKCFTFMWANTINRIVALFLVCLTDISGDLCSPEKGGYFY